MKKGFSTQWTDKSETEFLLKAIAEAGFDGVEPTFNSGAIPSPEFHKKEALWLKDRCEALGLSLPGMRGGRLFWGALPSASKAEREKALDHCKKGLETVAAMGGDVLLVVPGEAKESIPFHDHWERVIEFSGRAAEEARKFGVKIGLENTEALFPASLADWKKLLSEIGSAYIGMYLDVGNIVWLEKGNPSEWIRELSQQLLRIHLKDSFAGNCIVNILEGDTDWKAVMDSIHSIGYDGWLLVEPTWFKFAPETMPRQLGWNLDALLSL